MHFIPDLEMIYPDMLWATEGCLIVVFGSSAVSIAANISKDAEFLKYIAPFGYAGGADIIANSCLDAKMLSLGMAYTVTGTSAAYWKYCRKDITSG